jgi:hypothetical protein
MPSPGVSGSLSEAESHEEEAAAADTHKPDRVTVRGQCLPILKNLTDRVLYT